MADGVPVADVYKVLGTPDGVDRAFKKLDTIKNDIVWWDAGAAAAATPRLQGSGDDDRVERAHSKCDRP